MCVEKIHEKDKIILGFGACPCFSKYYCCMTFMNDKYQRQSLTYDIEGKLMSQGNLF